MARASYVFNASQVDGFDLPAMPEALGPVERIGNADRFVTSTGPFGQFKRPASAPSFS